MIKRDYKTDIDLKRRALPKPSNSKLSNARPLRKPEGYLTSAMTSGSFYFLLFTF
jgi:hypothetical protein